MTLNEITKKDYDGTHTKRLGTIDKSELSVGDVLEYQTDEGTMVQLGKVEDKEFDFDDSTWRTQEHYKVGEKIYCISDSISKR